MPVRRWYPVAAVAVLLVLAACASPSRQDRIEGAERAALAGLKSKYSNVIVGYDFRGTTLDVSVDLQAYDETDDDTLDAMRAAALRSWRRTWLTEHRREHGLLTVRFLDFRANLITKESARV